MAHENLGVYRTLVVFFLEIGKIYGVCFALGEMAML
jgi:hypothetical protein